MKRSQWLYEIFSYLLALLFFFTALSKVMDWHHFVRKMNNQVFIKPVASILTIMVPSVEAIAVILLVWIRFRVYGLWLSLLMMGAFTIYIGLILMRVFPKMPCACAGVFDSMTWAQHFFFNIGFTIIATAALGIDRKKDLLK